jgi:sugar phosphate isomerase/epimerase
MRFGVSGQIVPTNMDDVTPAVAEQVRALGFSGIFSRFRANDPHTTTAAQCHRVRDLLADHGLRMYQATGYWQCLVHPDEAARREAVRTLQAALRVAGWLGTYAIDTGPGSLSPNGPWFPHPYNYKSQARDQLIRSLREAAPAAEDSSVILGLESHLLVTLRTPEIARDVLDAVGSRWVRCDFDPVNWIGLDDIYDTGSALDRMVDILSDRIASAHAKDCVILDRLTLHLDVVAAGTGLLDYRTFLRRMEELNPDYPVIVEGASLAALPAVSTFLHQTAADLGIVVRGSV